MCLIVDANLSGEFLATKSPITDWLLGSGKPRLVVGGLLLSELTRSTEVRRLLVALQRAGRLRSFEEEKLSPAQRRIVRIGLCRSNDTHILALGVVSGARTLATRDALLAADFKNAKLISRARKRLSRSGEPQPLAPAYVIVRVK